MDWLRVAAIVLVSGFVASLTDWLAAGDWIHRRWTYPEVWRANESRAILATSVLPFLTATVFVVVARRLRLESLPALAKFAFAIWLIAPLPLILTNAAFIKLHRVFVASYAIGWLVKLWIVALAIVLIGR